MEEKEAFKNRNLKSDVTDGNFFGLFKFVYYFVHMNFPKKIFNLIIMNNHFCDCDN